MQDSDMGGKVRFRGFIAGFFRDEMEWRGLKAGGLRSDGEWCRRAGRQGMILSTRKDSECKLELKHKIAPHTVEP